MKTMLLSFRADVYKKVVTGQKIYEHRKVFPDERIRAYLYVSTPIKAVTGIMELGNKVSLKKWKEQYSYDDATVKRIDEYLKKYKFAMEILSFQKTNMLSLEKIRNDLDKFVVPQMYYYIENSALLTYLEANLHPEGDIVEHHFDSISSNDICRN